ncbi:MAG: glycohydrolase toxin TNT-related protein [Candidatus Omnitrophica bacterium]|nr:glycohydrolase toxin TNT-related protein [Candidatus Omnitrophota bacterium]
MTTSPFPFPRLSRCVASVTSVALVTVTCLLYVTPWAEAAEQRRIRYFHTDHLGSVTMVTDEQGQVVQETRYKPYGEIYYQSGSENRPHKFTGQRQDASTGLYYYNARYYDPQLARFTQPDSFVQAPVDPQTLNRYAYARNNPVKYVDPSGHFLFLAPLFSFLASLAELAFYGSILGALSFVGIGAITGQISSFSAMLNLAASGASFGATMAVGGPFVSAAVGTAGAGAFLGEMALLAAAGSVSGGVGSSLAGGTFGTGAFAGAVTSAATFGIGRAAAPVLRPLGQALGRTGAGQALSKGFGRVFQPLTNRMAVLNARAVGSLRGFGNALGGAAVDGPVDLGKITIRHPPNRGFEGEAARTILEPGTLIDRYGGADGSFLAPAGTPFGQRSLPAALESQSLHTYNVLKPLEVDYGKVAGWYGQQGGGMQYDLGKRTVQDLIDSGYLAPAD